MDILKEEATPLMNLKKSISEVFFQEHGKNIEKENQKRELKLYVQAVVEDAFYEHHEIDVNSLAKKPLIKVKQEEKK